jgi:hypothetical protein
VAEGSRLLDGRLESATVNLIGIAVQAIRYLFRQVYAPILNKREDERELRKEVVC